MSILDDDGTTMHRRIAVAPMELPEPEAEPRWVDPYGAYGLPATDKAVLPANSPSSHASAESPDWSTRRKAQPAEFLLPFSRKWLDQLPPEVFPHSLAKQYARIVNLIALQWNDRSDCAGYFKDLLLDRRGGRQGFPGPVRRDLLNLCAYFVRSSETRPADWDSVVA
jgi:hypothetical protein